MTGSLEKAYLTIVGFFSRPIEFFADQLMRSMKGLGTDEDHLIRVIVSRSEVTFNNNNIMSSLVVLKV